MDGGQNNKFSFSYAPEYHAFPLNLSSYYFLPLTQKMQAFLKIGAGYYFAKINYMTQEEERSWIGTAWEQDIAIARDKGIGFHGSVGLEYRLSKKLSFFLEGSGKSISFKNWKVDNKHKSPYGITDVKGTFWYVEEYDSYTNRYYPSLELSEERPSHEDIRNVRRAEISFSGFSIRFGIKITGRELV